MLDAFALKDGQKIGLMLLSVGLGLILLGCLLFFDASLLSLGNVVFLSGWPFFIGWKQSLAFFNPVQAMEKDTTAFWRKTSGRIMFWFGLVLVVMRWGLIGAMVEIAGLLIIFGAFLGSAIGLGRNLPVVGPVLSLPGVSTVVDLLAGKAKEERPRPV